MALQALKRVWVRVVAGFLVSSFSLNYRAIEVFLTSCDVRKVVTRLTHALVGTSSKTKTTDESALKKEKKLRAKIT